MRIRRTEARSARRRTVLLVALLAAVFLQEFCSAGLLNASADEPAHLPAGYTYWKTGDFRLNPEHPPFIKLLSSLPIVLFMNPVVRWDDPSWLKDPPDQVQFGVRFLYSNHADEMLFWGRLPVILLSVLLGYYVTYSDGPGTSTGDAPGSSRSSSTPSARTSWRTRVS